MSDFEKYTLILRAVQAGTATVLAILAIWGEAIRKLFAGPRLLVRLKNPLGYATVLQDGIPARYYHLLVSNQRRWAPAKNVTVLLIGIEEQSHNDSWQNLAMPGPARLVW